MTEPVATPRTTGLNVVQAGAGPPLVLLHGTNSAASIWRPLMRRLARERHVLAIDLPGHGASPPTSYAPGDFAADIAALLSRRGVERPAVVGHSVGGWTALELARSGCAGAVLALAPAGLWRRRSPRATDLGLWVNWHVARRVGSRGDRLLRRPRARRWALASVAVHGDRVRAEDAVLAAQTARASAAFPRHFAETRSRRFSGGAAIDPDVTVHVVWGAQDRVALRTRSRFPDELPPHAVIETWSPCGHMAMWDRPDAVVSAALSLRPGTR